MIKHLLGDPYGTEALVVVFWGMHGLDCIVEFYAT